MSSQRVEYAKNGDTAVAYRTLGEGELDLIFVSGFVSHLELWSEFRPAREFFERLASFARVIVFDKRGMGLSEREGGAYTVEAVAEDMACVLDAAGSERAAVFGISEGGAASCYFAATYPERTRALALYGTYARMPRDEDNPAGIPVGALRSMAGRMGEEWGGDAHLEWWAPSLAGEAEARAWWGRFLRAGTTPSAIGRVMRMYEELDVRPILELIRVPTLVLARRDDTLLPAALTRGVAAGIPGARYVELDGRDHLFCAGDKEAVLDELEEFLTGSRPQRSPERALATVLFTDIVGSTERAAELGDAGWRDLLERHDRLARASVEAERGRLVKSTGDGVLATFDGPGRAIAAARSLRNELGGLGLEIRSGIHTGECEQLGADLGGLAVHIGARVGSAAGPGEILVSQTVRDLVVGSGIEFSDRGAQVLKGVPGEWRLYAVGA